MKTTNGWTIYISLILAVLIVGAFYLVPGLRGVVSDLREAYAPRDVYAPVRSAIDKCLSGTRYSVLHIPSAGVAVILNVSPTDAKLISDPTVNFTSGSIFIDPSFSDYDSHTSNLNVGSVPQLQGCYQLTVPRRDVSAVVVDWDIPTDDAITAILNGVDLKELGPDLGPGTYIVFDNDHDLVRRLYSAGIINGTVQTTSSDAASQSSNNSNSTDDVIVPLEVGRTMDVKCGEVASASD